MATTGRFTFPSTGAAFSALKVKEVDSEPGPPPRKAARHDSMAHSPHPPRLYSSSDKRVIRIVLDTPVQVNKETLQAISNQVNSFIRSYMRLDAASTNSLPSFEDILTSCKTLIEAGEGEGIKKTLERSIEQCARDIVKELSTKSDGWDNWIKKWNERWGWWTRRINALRSTLLYLDALYLMPKGESPIKEVGYQVFAHTLFGSPAVQHHSDEIIKEWSEAERANRATSEQRRAATRFIDSVTTLGLYEDQVESAYIRFTSSFYAARSKSALGMSAMEYLKQCAADLEEEDTRGRGILKDETVVLASRTALGELVAPQVERLAKEGLSEIITAQNREMLIHLHRLVALFTLAKPDVMIIQELESPTSPTSPISPIKSRASFSTKSNVVTPSTPLEVLLAHYRNDIFSRVKVIVTDAANDATMVERLLGLKEYLDTTLSDKVFEEEKKWGYATGEAFERGFACRKIKPAEMIAKHIDSLLKAGQKSSSDSEFFQQMKRVLGLYRYSPDKDVFRTFYTRALAKRLLLDRSASTDFEKEVLKFLSESYDAAFTDCSQMFNDLAVSRDLNESYKNDKRQRPDEKLDVKVLQHSVWPVIRKASKTEGVEIRLPSRMELALSDFATFYKSKHANRKLSWGHYLGTATLTARFPAAKKEMTMSLYQAIVLLLFNEKETWTTQEVQEEIQLAMPDLILTMQSLALGRKLVLKRTTPRSSKDVQPDDSWSFNESFTDSKHKLHINTIQQNDTVEETQLTEKVIDQMREGSLDAAIVRIMKGKKTLKSQQLVNEVIEGVAKHFRPDVKMIKARIDSLLERDFISRSEENRDTFEYVA